MDIDRWNSMTQPWVSPFLNNDYFSVCSCSSAKGCNFYCNDCMGVSFCESCKPSHEGHHILQIRKTSNRDSIHKSEIQELLDVSQIQPVKINGEIAVFLNPKKGNEKGNSGNGDSIKKENSGNICEVCSSKITKPGYGFCSIACKRKNSTPHSFRTWVRRLKRKGMPTRSPLF